MSTPASSRHDAQRRADQMRAFRSEVAALAREGVEALAPDRVGLVAAHHDALLSSLASRFDVDRTEAGRRMSLGMRIASAFGAAALTAAIVSFFYRVWGSLVTPAQVMLLTAAPVAALAAMVVAARRERTLYVASLCAIVACGAFVLQTIMLGDLFNTRGSVVLLAAWAAFGFAVALPYRFAAPFAAAIGAAICFVAALLIMLGGAPWHYFGERPETVLPPAVAAYLSWHRMPRDLQAWMRGIALIFGLGAVLALSTFDSSSFLPLPQRGVSALYQILAGALAFVVVGHGLRTGRREMIAIGATFAGMFLLGRFVDWWWDWMPKYLFFLILAALAIGAIWLLRSLRARFGEAA